MNFRTIPTLFQATLRCKGSDLFWTQKIAFKGDFLCGMQVTLGS